jgi:hypothetical protein
MNTRKTDPTPLEAFLAPLARQARKNPDLEGLVFWGGADGWGDAPTEALEAEEIAFYAEGLLLDGFHMRWALLALAESPDQPDHLRLEFWQDDSPEPKPPIGWVTVESGRWTAV